MKTIYLIDANFYVFRAYFSISKSGMAFAVAWKGWQETNEANQTC